MDFPLFLEFLNEKLSSKELVRLLFSFLICIPPLPAPPIWTSNLIKVSAVHNWCWFGDCDGA